MLNDNEPTMREILDITDEDAELHDIADMTRSEFDEHQTKRRVETDTKAERLQKWRDEYLTSESQPVEAVQAPQADANGELTDDAIRQLFPSDDPGHIRAMLGKMSR